VGNRTKLTYPDASYITYEYDNINRLKKIKNQGSSTLAEYTYDSRSRRTDLDYLNGTTLDYTYAVAIVPALEHALSVTTLRYKNHFIEIQKRIGQGDFASEPADLKIEVMAVRRAFFAASFEIGQFLFKLVEVGCIGQSLKIFEQGRYPPKSNIADKAIFLIDRCLVIQKVRRNRPFSGLASLNVCFQLKVLLHPYLPDRLTLGPCNLTGTQNGHPPQKDNRFVHMHSLPVNQ